MDLYIDQQTRALIVLYLHNSYENTTNVYTIFVWIFYSTVSIYGIRVTDYTSLKSCFKNVDIKNIN